MIKINKANKPDILVQDGDRWTQELMTMVNGGIKIPDHIRDRYKHHAIKSAIKRETNEKCVYCESYITHQYPGDVEHIIPKSAYPRLTYNWSNLTLACHTCNNNKRDFVDKTCKMLNPYKDNLSSHIKAFGPLLFHINDCKRGELTWKKLDLNRIKLIERRTDALKVLQSILDKFNRETTPALKDILRQELLDCANFDQEFSMFKLEFLKSQGVIV